MTRVKILVVLATLIVGCSLFPDPDSTPPKYNPPVPTPQPNPCTAADLNGSNDGGVSEACACYQESASLPCYQRNSCGDVVGNGYCTNNTVCIMAPPFGRTTMYYCECLLSCENKACGEDNGCGIKCDALCANGFECTWDTIGAKGCRDKNKCKGKPCGFVDDEGYSCNGTCPAGTHCESGGDLFVQDQKETREFSCVCTTNCSNKGCGASDGCGGTCDDACPPTPPDPCIAADRDVDFQVSILADGSWIGTATNKNKEEVTCEFMGGALTLTRVLAPKQTVNDLAWPKETYSVFHVCFLSASAAACFAEF